jgi:hypothetical protein
MDEDKDRKRKQPDTADERNSAEDDESFTFSADGQVDDEGDVISEEEPEASKDRRSRRPAA